MIPNDIVSGSGRRMVILVAMIQALGLAGCRQDGQALGVATPKVELKANIEPRQTTVMVAPFEGRVARVAVTEGAVVKSGDLLIEMTNATVERDLINATTQRVAAEHRARPSAGSRSGDGNESVKAAADILRNRKAKLDRYRRLFATHDITEDELRQVEVEYSVARRDWLAERERTTNAAGTDPEMLRLDVERARADEELASSRKKMLAIRSTADGTVIRIRAAAGESVFARDPLVEVADTNTVLIRAEIAPELLRYIHTGLPVQVRIFTVPPRRMRLPIWKVTEANATTPAALYLVVPNSDHTLQSGVSALITLQ